MKPQDKKTGWMTHNDIENAIHEEDTALKIPADAHSKFKFEIKENVSDLLHQIEVDSRKNIKVGYDEEPKLGYRAMAHTNDKKETVSYSLYNPVDTWNFTAEVKKTDAGLHIVTASSGFVYEITQKENNKGCTVEFDGPINGLMTQELLPKMTYISGTLEGKFVDADTHKDLTGYMDIVDYCDMRIGKDTVRNPQDKYGMLVNKAFNNEIPIFPGYLSKNEKAQKDFEEGKKVDEWILRYRKEYVRERIEQNKQMSSDVKKGMETTKKSGYKYISRSPAPDKGRGGMGD